MKRELLHGKLTAQIIGAFLQVHCELPGRYLESVYANAMEIALRELGLHVEREVSLAVYFRGHRVGNFRADMLVEKVVLLEYKAGDLLDPNWEAQLLNNLSVTRLEVGLTLFFGPKPIVKRRIFTNDRKLLPPSSSP